jgi:S1-C subfamily serine protease
LPVGTLIDKFPRMRVGLKLLLTMMVLASAGMFPAMAKTINLRNLPVDAQQAMLKVCKVNDGKVQKRHLECLDHHARAWRKLTFKPDLESLSLRQARKLREACSSDMSRGPVPWARCVENAMTDLKVAADFPDLSQLTRPLRNRARQSCDSAAKVSIYREAACLTKLRDRFLQNPPQQPGPSAMSETNTQRGSSPIAEKVGKSGKATGQRVAVLTPGVLNFNSLDPSNPYWPSWRGARPARPSVATHADTTLETHQLYERVAKTVYVVLAAASVEDFRASRNVKQGSAVAISDSHLATNCHILKDAKVIVLLQGEDNGRARLLFAHPATDRCVLESQDMALNPAPGVRSFGDLKMGEKVWSVAAPHGLQQTFHDGVVSQLRSNNGIELVQTSAHAAPGSSGGGLFDAVGNLVGITNFTIAEDTRLHFAIAAGAYWE